MDRLLLLHENQDLRDLLEAELRSDLGAAVDVVSVASCDAALLAAANDPPFRFGVWGAGVAATAADEPDNVGHAALKEKLASLAARCPAFVVLAAVDDDDLRRRVGAHAGGALSLVAPNTDWLAAARKFARVAFGLEADGREVHRTRAVLQIVVCNESQGQWRIERRGRLEGAQEGTLTFGQGVLEDWRDRSAGLLDQLQRGKWDNCLPLIGRDIYRLFADATNQQLGQAFREMLSEVGGPDKVRVVFGLPNEHQALPVETIKDLERATKAEHWYALQSAILRHYEGSGPSEPLFWDRPSRTAPVDCLLVAADPRDGMIYEALPQIEHEIDEIAKVLRRQKRKGANVGAIEVLKLQEKDNPETALGVALAKRPWKLVHFAGHADIDAGDGERGASGAIALSPAREAVLDFAQFARALPAVQFLFVSSCRSANAAFLQEAIRQSVPAVLGYRWPVYDEDARDLAAAFYDALFAPEGPAYRSLGRALSLARKKVFDTYLSHFTWASPVLLAKGSVQARGDALAAPRPEAARAGATP